MPAINVARTDTFEQQRQKINEIGSVLFGITAGGSDLATGNLRIGDGTKSSPSLAFDNEPSLGIYRPSNGVLGYVYNNKKLSNFTLDSFINFKDIILEKNIISVGGLLISNGGTNYDAGLYSGISLNGGTGTFATADIEVTEFTGIVTEDGENYIPGTYQSIPLEGGSGSGAIISFNVENISGSITNSGSSYKPGIYNNIPITTISGSGSGAAADITITGTTDISGSITNAGSGYDQSFDFTSVPLYNVPSQSFSVTVVSNPGSPPPDNVYQINGVTQDTLNLNVGNTYRFDVSDSSMSGHPLVFQNTDGSPLDPFSYSVVNVGTPGTAGSFIDFIILETVSPITIKYNCSIHDGMGANISIVNTGSIGNYGNGMRADISTNATGQISSVSIVLVGNNYKPNDTLQVSQIDIPTGSGFLYTLGSFTYNGIVQSINFINQGQDYETGDQISINDLDVGGVGGSGFIYTIESNPGSISELLFTDKGDNYQVGDLLSLPISTSTSAFFKGSVSGLSANVSSATTTVILSSTSGLVPGMQIIADPLQTAELFPGTTIASVDSPTQITLSDLPVTSGSTTLDFTLSGNLAEIEVSNSTGIVEGSFVSVTNGSGTLPAGTIVNSISGNIVTLSNDVSSSGVTTVEFIPPFGLGNPAFEFEIQNLGEVISIAINNQGNGYEFQDSFSVNPSDLTQPINFIVTNVNTQKIDFVNSVSSGTISVGDRVTPSADGVSFYDVLEVKEINGNINYILVSGITVSSGDSIQVEGSSVDYEVNTSTSGYRYLIDGNASPSITLYSGNIYRFDLSDSSNSSHNFSLSKFRDGRWGPSLIEDVDGSITAGSNSVTLSSTTGILPGMEVVLVSGSGIISNTFVESIVNQTTITISNSALISDNVVLTFRGVEYTDGVTKTSSELLLKVTDVTPNLYYYCNVNSETHANEGGHDNEEILLTVDTNNPKVFGSGFSCVVSSITTSNSITLDNFNEKITTTNIESSVVESSSGSISNFSSDTAVISTSLSTPLIDNGTVDLNVTSPNTLLSGGLSVSGGILTVNNSTGNLNTSGVIKTTNYFDSNNALRITGSTISSLGSNDIEFVIASNRVVKYTSSTALILPSGSSSQRPTLLAADGAIRFNTETDQYEGYNSTTSSWSSLGGVRDLDGNTTILAEETIGANDDTLWFINDNINSIKVSRTFLSFENAKSIRSSNVLAPNYSNWIANVPVSAGEYLKYFNNLYLVVSGGTTGTSGNEPIDTSGNDFINGNATLRYFTKAVSPLVFEEMEELRVGPLGNLPLVVNSDLRFANNEISTDISDLVIRPNSGKKVVIDATTTLAIPSGSDADRGIAIQGSIRFNTTASQFEGYDGTNWGSLGGVKDVDQNTYIIPELSPGSNENILYFFNDNNNTLQLTTSSLNFYAVDTIRSVTSNQFEITASLLSFDNATTTLDNTSTNSTFLHTTKQYFDIGLSAGLTTDPVLRLDDQGDVFFNIAFGTGVFNGVKVFDSQLKEFELAQIIINTDKVNLVKGTVDSGNSIIYDSTISSGSKTTVVANNTSTGEKEFFEFGIIDNGSDVFYTEYGNIRTNTSLIIPSFTYTENSEVRIDFSLSSDVSPTESVDVIITSNVTKN